MLQGSGSKGEKTAWTRRWLCFLILLLLGTLMLTFYLSGCRGVWPVTMRSMRSWSSRSSDNVTAPVDDIPPAELPPYFVAYPRRYAFLLDEPRRCSEESPFLVLMIPVAPRDREARDIIRNTWGKETSVLGRVVSRYFLLGLSRQEEGAETLEEQVFEESRAHRDILQSDFVDSYNNLTIKTMVMLEWLSARCPIASYGMKVDSDMFLNVRNLVAMLLTAPRRLYMTGMVARGASVLRDHTSKWFLPESAFPESTFPPYALGLGYVFSLDLPPKIVAAAAHVRAVYIEDVYVGLCMRRLGIDPTDPPRGALFQGLMPAGMDACYWTSVITTILQNSEQLSHVWREYEAQDNSSACRNKPTNPRHEGNIHQQQNTSTHVVNV